VDRRWSLGAGAPFQIQLLDRDPLSFVGLMRYMLSGLLESVCFNIAVAPSTFINSVTFINFLFVAGVRGLGGFFGGSFFSWQSHRCHQNFVPEAARNVE